MFVLKRTNLPVHVDVLRVIEGGPSRVYGGNEHLGDAGRESIDVRAPQRIDTTVPSKSGAMKYLVRVDIPDAGDDMLVEQHGLDHSLSLVQSSLEDVGVELIDDRIDAEPTQLRKHLLLSRRVVHDDFTESPRVDEPKFVSVFLAVARKCGDDVGVWQTLVGRVCNHHSTTHP